MERIISFDLSSKCIGVVAAILNNKDIIKMRSTSIVPTTFKADSLGYLVSKKKILTRSGKKINSYLRPGEDSVSEKEKKRRDIEVRNAKNKFVLAEISKSIRQIIDGINPTIILVEKNEIFNGVLTSVLLAEVRGILVGLSNSRGIDIVDIKVKEARSILNKSCLIKKLVKEMGREYVKNLPDVTKRALMHHMNYIYSKYELELKNDDEGDACVILHYYLNKRVGI